MLRRAKLDGRRVEAVKWRSRLYALSLCMGGLGAGLWFVLKNDVLSIIVVAVCALAMVGLGVKGYLKGEEWRMKVVTEKMIEDKIERRAEELVVGIHAEYRARVKEEKALKAAERAEKKRKRLEREEVRGGGGGGWVGRRALGLIWDDACLCGAETSAGGTSAGAEQCEGTGGGPPAHHAADAGRAGGRRAGPQSQGGRGRVRQGTAGGTTGDGGGGRGR